MPLIQICRIQLPAIVKKPYLITSNWKFPIIMPECPEKIEQIINALHEDRNWEFNFRCLYERYFSRTRLFFIRKKLSPEDALELTQEVFFSVYQKLDALRSPEDFEAWLYRISLNTFRNFLEKNKSAKRAVNLISAESEVGGEDLLETIAADILSPLESLIEAEFEAGFRRAIRGLPEQMRRVFYLKIVREMKNHEIAAALGISVNTVKAHIFQARQKLRETLLETSRK